VPGWVREDLSFERFKEELREDGIFQNADEDYVLWHPNGMNHAPLRIRRGVHWHVVIRKQFNKTGAAIIRFVISLPEDSTSADMVKMEYIANTAIGVPTQPLPNSSTPLTPTAATTPFDPVSGRVFKPQDGVPPGTQTPATGQLGLGYGDPGQEDGNTGQEARNPGQDGNRGQRDDELDAEAQGTQVETKQHSPPPRKRQKISGNGDDTFAKGGQSDSRHSGVKPPPISTNLGSSGGGDGKRW
jgi:hypothetical protein